MVINDDQLQIYCYEVEKRARFYVIVTLRWMQESNRFKKRFVWVKWTAAGLYLQESVYTQAPYWKFVIQI